MRILELFSGYGTASFALKQLGIDYELIGYSDIDRYANQCFKQNHIHGCGIDCTQNRAVATEPDFCGDGILCDTCLSKELGDCTEIDPNDLGDFDLLTGGFPCQSFSVAGKGLGELDTRGTLFNEIIRIAEVKNPRYMLLENVKGLMSKKHKPTFDKIISELYRIGYFVKWKVLNTKEHGIPQNRERVFFTCFKYWNDFCNFEWPEKEELKIFLKDILEEEVDDKYFLSEKAINLLINRLNTSYESKFNPDVSNTLRTNYGNGYSNESYIIGNVNPSSRGMNGNVYSGDVSPTITTNKGEGLKILLPFIAASRGRNVDNPSDRTPGNKTEQRLEPKTDGTSNTITSVQKDNYVVEPTILQRPHGANKGGERALDGVVPSITSGASWEHNNYLINDLTIRKLTPLECFRLQGFLNDEVILEGISNSQQYKLAGNGQSVNIVKKIFKNMFKELK